MKKLLLSFLLLLGTISLHAQSDIVVFNTNPDYEYEVGEILSFSVMVTNNGPNPAQSVNVSYPIPAGITIVPGYNKFWWTGSNGSSGTNLALNNTIPSLGVNQTVTYTINIKIPNDYVANLPVISVTYNTQSDVQVSYTNNQSVYVPGSQAIYEVSVVNYGPEVASVINVSNPIPAGITSFSWTGSNGSSGTNQNLTNQLQNLPLGQVVTYTITADIPSGFTGPLTSQLTVNGPFTDPTPACAPCTDTDLPPTANIVVENTNGQQLYTPGTQTTYTLTVTNVGPYPANNITVNNPVPAGISSFTWSGDNGTSGSGALTDVIAAMGVGETVTYTLIADIPANFTGNLISEASVTTGSIDPAPGCPGCNDTDTSSAIADVVTVVDNGQVNFTPGSASQYTVAVTNNGPGAAQNVQVDVAIPADITLFSWSGSNGSSGTDEALADTIATLAAGETVTYTIDLEVPLTYAGTVISVEAVVTTDTEQTSVNCPQCNDTDVLAGNGADVTVTNTNGQTTYIAGTEAIYTVTVTNNGPAAAENVLLTFDFPSQITEYEWTSGSTTVTNQPLQMMTLTMAPGQTIIYSITLNIPENFTGDLVTVAAISSDNDFDTTCTGCTDTDTQDFPEYESDIVVEVDNGQDIYTPGTQSVYNVVVTNNGPDNAENVSVAGALPAGITSYSWTGSNGSSGNGALADNIALLYVGQSVSYTVTIDVPAAYSGELTTEVTAASDSTDPDTTCDTCTDTDSDPNAEADIVVEHTLNQGTSYTAGADAVYTITVTNNGPDNAVNVSVSDAVPAGIDPTTVFWSGNDTSGTGDLQDVIAFLPVGESVQYTFTVPVPSNFDQETDIVNTVVVSTDTTDPDPSCDACTITAEPDPQANLVTLKTNYQDTYLKDSEVIYYITITNPGPSDAYNVGVFDPVPFDIEFMQWQGDNVGGFGPLTHTIPVLAAGETAEFTVTIQVPEDYVENLQNVVNITSDTPDPVPACPGCTDLDEPAVDYVTVDKYAYTVTELVEDVLIDAECVNVSNIISQAGSLTGNYGIGYFHKNNSNFPIKDGLILRCGNAEFSEGPFTGGNTTSVASGTGDAQLQAVSAANGQGGSINDVTFIQFNFVPLTDTMSFDFLFSSNEYGVFQCSYSDVFAFLLTDLTDGSVTNVNLAVIPGTNIPVSVTTIRNNLYNSGCSSQNVAYFGQQNAANPATAAINMNGQTVVMTASSPVIPGHTYRIKLAIGDYLDTALDSAVWIAAGSFDIGQPELPDNLTVANGTALCSYESYELTVDAGNAEYNYEWQLDGTTLLDDENNPINSDTITVTEPGEYTVLATYVADPDCQLTDTIIIEEIPDIDAQEPADLLIFDDGSNPTLTWDLTQNNAVVTEGLNNPDFYEVFYYDNIEGLEEEEAIPVFPSDAYAGTDGQTVYVTIKGFDNDCYTLKSFELYTLTPPDDIELCKEVPHDVAEVINLTDNTTAIYSPLLNPADFTITYHETELGAEDGSEVIADPANYQAFPLTFIANTKTIYIRVQNNEDPDSFAIWSFDIIISLKPAEVDLEPISICEPEDDDDTATFDLTERVNEILAASPNIDVDLTMYATLQDAQNNANSLTYPVYTTTEDASQMVYFRAIQEGAPDEACVTYIPLELFVSPASEPQAPENVQVCNPENDDFEVFDLTQFDGTVLSGLNPDLYTITYHETAEDAESGDNPITEPETYTVNVGTVTVYIRLTNNLDADCFSTTSFMITVTPTPVVEVPADGFACFVDGYALPTLAAGNYYTQPGGEGTMLDEGTVITATQTIYVYAESGTSPNNCTDEGSFTVTIYPQPAIPTPSNYPLCDDNNPGDLEEEFDLTTRDASVTGGVA
ncbi:choice-of-anchor L domain-containing protein, partial [Flavobacterium coralii]|uniref:choice-of-anchor L domain-containing protein n=1 Tax=Flavobacterium coralii TaxID=2838017 RepID=UPI0032B25054